MCLAGTLLLPSGPQDNFYCEKIRVFKACDFQALNTLAWNNRIGPGSYSVGLFDQVMINRDGRGICIPASEVKFLDRWKTTSCESVCQGRFHWSRTKVRGSKTIRYRRSLYYKLWGLEIEYCKIFLYSASSAKAKFLLSGGEYGRKAET